MKRKSILSLIIVGLLAIGFTIIVNQESMFWGSDSSLLNDYTSEAYNKIKPSDINLTEDELLEKLHISQEEREQYRFTFYLLDYNDIVEIHAKGKSETNNCYTVALTNAKNLIKPLRSAFLFSFFQSSEPGEQTDIHKCEGDPCENCDFTRDDDGEIDGCRCTTLGTCNHTVISG